MKYFLASNATIFLQNSERLTSKIGFTNLTAWSEKLAQWTSLTLTMRFREKRLPLYFYYIYMRFILFIFTKNKKLWFSKKNWANEGSPYRIQLQDMSKMIHILTKLQHIIYSGVVHIQIKYTVYIKEIFVVVFLLSFYF